MIVTHILKNGQMLPDITGHLVKIEDAPNLVNILERRGRNDLRNRELQPSDQTRKALELDKNK